MIWTFLHCGRRPTDRWTEGGKTFKRFGMLIREVPPDEPKQPEPDPPPEKEDP